MQLLEKILFPTDFGESMDTAYTSVVNIAKEFGSEVILLHVLPENIVNERLKSLVTKKMEEIAAKMKAENIKSSFEVAIGDSTGKIVEVAERKRVNLIMLGAGKAREMEFKLGSNSEKIIQNTSVPVWVIEKNKPVSLDAILCPVDFSEESSAALDSAVHLSRRFKAKLTILHVVKSFGSEYAIFDVDLGDDESNEVKRITQEFETFLSSIKLDGINWEKKLVLGEPADEILAEVADNNIGLIVMGSEGKTGLRRLFIGSVTEKVARKVPCSFIITKSESLIQLKLNKELSDIDTIYQEGVQLEKDGFVEQAINAWKRCTVINELYIKAWSKIASAYDNLGDKENAKKYNEIKNKIQQSIWDKQVEADLRSKHDLYK